MVCEEFVGLIAAWADGEVDAATEIALLEHLAQCPDCAAYLDQIRRTTRLIGELRAAESPSLAPRSRQRLRAAFRDAHRGDTGRGRTR